MRCRWKCLLGLGLAIIALNGILLLLSRQVFLDSYIRLERRQARETLQRGVGVYREHLAFLKRLAGDWAQWDDAYDFMQSRDHRFLLSNVVDSTFTSLNLNVLVFLDDKGKIVAGKAFDLNKQSEVPIYAGLQQLFRDGWSQRVLRIHAQGVHGLVSLPEGSLLMALQPVLTGEGKGPPRGTLLMGRFLDPAELGRLRAKANLPFEFTRLESGPEWMPWTKTANPRPQILLRAVDSHRLRSRILLRDIWGQPAQALGVTLPREIYARGRQAMVYFHLGLLLFSIAAGSCIWLIWVRLVSSEQKQRDSESLFRHVFQNSVDAFFLCDANGRFLDANQQACRVLGRSRPDLLELGWADVADTSLEDARGAANVLSAARFLPCEVTMRGRRGQGIPAEISVSRVALLPQSYFFVLARDISERRASENMLREQKLKLDFLAYHDVLTGLPNRLKALELLQGAIARARNRNTTVAALLFDIDRFKNINESLGHVVGDQILMEVARRIQGGLRGSDVVARFGGDEFLVLLENPADGEGGRAVAQKLLKAMACPLQIGRHRFYLTGSVGISLFPQHGGDAQAILKAADNAMFHAKAQGRNTCRFFMPSLQVDVEARLNLETDLHRALEQQQFHLTYQPQFNLQTGSVIGLEALLRWRHPTRGLVPPDEFIPLAEDTGLIVPIGEWVLREACRQMVAWHRGGFPRLRMAVNISARQFRQSGFIDMVFRLLRHYGLEPGLLELEITERVVIQSAEHARNMLTILRQAGICLAVDDFGLGYSSLSYLRTFPFSKLKMDQAFSRNLADDACDRAIAEAIVSMGRTLGMEVVAEGIETALQLDTLRSLGCPSGQGFHLAQPMTAAETAAFLRGHPQGEFCPEELL